MLLIRRLQPSIVCAWRCVLYLSIRCLCGSVTESPHQQAAKENSIQTMLSLVIIRRVPRCWQPYREAGNWSALKIVKSLLWLTASHHWESVLLLGNLSQCKKTEIIIKKRGGGKGALLYDHTKSSTVDTKSGSRNLSAGAKSEFVCIWFSAYLY